MGSANLNILIFAIFLAIMVLGFLATGAVYLFSTGRQVTKARLEKRQARYATSVAVDMRKAFTSTDELPTIENILRRFVPKREVFRQRLAKTGKKITFAHYVSMMLLFGLVTFLTLEFIFSTPWLLSFLMGVFLAIQGPQWVVSFLVKKRINNFIHLFPDALDLLVRGLRSGLPIAEVMGSIAEEIPDPVGTEFRKVIDSIRLGRDMDAALEDVAQRIDLPEFKFFMITLTIQRETGGNLAETLSKLSELLRRRQAMKLKIRAMASEGKASAYIVGLLPFALFAFLLMANYDYTSVLFTDPRAITASIIGLVWLAIGGFIMSRMIAFEI